MRVELVDQPGALAGLTAVLAGLGVDVASVDVLEVDGGTVVDELLLRRPRDVSTQEVEDALRLGGALDVLSSHVDTRRGDPTVRAMELVGGWTCASRRPKRRVCGRSRRCWRSSRTSLPDGGCGRACMAGCPRR